MRVQSEKNTDIDLGKTKAKFDVIVAELMDASGSMMRGQKYTNAIAGINEEVNLLKADKKSKYRFCFTEFDTDAIATKHSYYGTARYRGNMFDMPIDQVPIIKGAGADGYTPLYEAVGYMINQILNFKKPEDRVVLKIFTDGDENASQGEYANTPQGRKSLYDLIKKVQENDNFTVTFVGTKQDTETVIRNLGIERGNTLTHNNTAKDIGNTYIRGAGATMVFAEEVNTKGVKSSKTFYSKDVQNQ